MALYNWRLVENSFSEHCNMHKAVVPLLRVRVLMKTPLGNSTGTPWACWQEETKVRLPNCYRDSPFVRATHIQSCNTVFALNDVVMKLNNPITESNINMSTYEEIMWPWISSEVTKAHLETHPWQPATCPYFRRCIFLTLWGHEVHILPIQWWHLVPTKRVKQSKLTERERTAVTMPKPNNGGTPVVERCPGLSAGGTPVPDYTKEGSFCLGKESSL